MSESKPIYIESDRVKIYTNLNRNDLEASQTYSDNEIENNLGFGISAYALEKIVEKYKERGYDFKDLEFFREQNGITNLLHSLSTNEVSGISSTNGREEIYGSNKVPPELIPPFRSYLYVALQDMMVRILIICAIIEIILGCTL